jgi:hypothetical protein
LAEGVGKGHGGLRKFATHTGAALGFSSMVVKVYKCSIIVKL